MVPALRISRRPWDEVGAQSRAQSPTVSCQESGNGIKSHGILNRKRHLFLLVCAFSSFHYSVEMSIGFFLANGKEPFFLSLSDVVFCWFPYPIKRTKRLHVQFIGIYQCHSQSQQQQLHVQPRPQACPVGLGLDPAFAH